MTPDTHRAIDAARAPELDLEGEPDFPAATLPGTGPGGSVEAVLQQRLSHVMRGLTPQSDAKGPDCFLENELERWIHRARLTRSKTGDDPAAALLRARKAYVHAAAVALAIIDRIDFITGTNASSSAAVDETSKDLP